jgi:O-antigen ligase
MNLAERIVFSTTVPQQNRLTLAAATENARLAPIEQIFLFLGIVEIPIGVDKYYLYSEQDAQWGAVAGFSVSLTAICFFFLYVVWALRVMRRELPLPTFFGAPQLVYLAAVALSIVTAPVRQLGLCDLFLLLQAYGLFFYVANRIRRIAELKFVIRCLAIGMAIQGLIMIGQKSLGESAYGQTYELSMLKFIVWEDGRTAGTLHSAVLAGSWLAIVWLVVLPLFLVERQPWQRFILAACLTIGMLGMLFTQTRGAIITAGLGCFVLGSCMFYRGWLPRWFSRVAVVAVLLAMIPLLQIVQKRVLQGDEGSAESRKHLSAIAFQTIARNPIWGYGAGNCHLACLPVANSAEFRSEWYYTIHCKYLLVWIENGIFGLLAFLAVLWTGLRQGIFAWHQKHPVLSPLGLGCVAAIAGHMVHMLVDIFNSRPQVQILWLVLGITAAISRPALRGGLTRSTLRRRTSQGIS